VKLNGQLLTVDLIERSLLHVACEVSEVLNITSRTETKVDEIATGVKNLLNEKAKKEPPKIPVEIKSLLNEAKSAIDQCYYEKGRDVSQKALELAKKIDNKAAIGKAILLLARILYEYDKDYTKAISLLNESLECFKYADSEYDIANTLFELGEIEIAEGRFDEASAFMTQAIEIDKRNDEKNRVALALHQLGWIEYRRGHTKEAIELYDEAIKYFFSNYNDSDTEVKKKCGSWDSRLLSAQRFCF
jgi:tetratricopeptide (TPR) repeat protein